jgi:hypothetical protein
MKTFKLIADITVSVYTNVEAETLDEAIELANDRYSMQVLHDESNDPNEEWILDEIDGEVFNVRQE